MLSLKIIKREIVSLKRSIIKISPLKLRPDIIEVMLLQINKQLIRTEFRFQSRLQTIFDNESSYVTKFLKSFLDASVLKSEQKIKESRQQQARKEMREFIVSNFDNLVKKRQLIELLFYLWVQNQKQDQIQNIQSQDNKCNRSSQGLTKLAAKLKEFLIDTISQNNRLYKELYHVLQSNSPLGQCHLRPDYYKQFYQLISEIDSKSKKSSSLNEDQTETCWLYFIDQLTYWWSLCKDYLITTKYNYLRYNLLAYFIQHADKQLMLSYQNGVLISRITVGIQKRLVQTKYHQPAILIWSKFAQVLNLDLQNDIHSNTQYFHFQEENLTQQQKIYQSSLKNQHRLISEIQPQENQIHQFSDKKQLQQKNQHFQFNQSDSNQENNPLNEKKPSQISSQDQNLEEQTFDQFIQVKIKPPQTLQDCILALNNPLRRQSGFKQLKKLIKKQQQDLIFVWKSLIRSLLAPISNQSKEILKDLLVIRPKQWIEDVADIFFKKDLGLNQKIILIQCIQDGVNELSQNPIKKEQVDDQKGDFYFKRVTSKYYTQKPQIETKNPSQSRRWGYTRIAHQESQKKGKTITSLFVMANNDSYINRLYPVVTQIFFKIIVKLIPESQKSFMTQTILAQRILNLMGTVAHNIKNYHQKYLILEEISLIVDRLLTYIETQSERGKKQSKILNSEVDWNSKGVSSIVISCIQVLNKVSLSIDKYLPDMLLLNLKDCVQKLKKIDIYSIRPLVEMIEANIYKRIT